ncbi:MAG: NAD(P)/FAD-dependent oxidoreductase [Chthoniobacterales bacterium]
MTTYDVAVIGGGPAGSTAATLLAKRGRSVVVIEREKFPRFHIGESLLPFSMSALDRLGVLPKLNAAGFMPKHGAEIATGSGDREVRFYFKNGFQPQSDTAFQVERSRFDELLLDHAAETGATVHQSTAVESVDFDSTGSTLAIRHLNTGQVDSLRAQYIIDCSGRNTLVGSKFKLKRTYPNLQKFAIYAHYDGVQMPEGIDGTLTRMVRADDHWFWLIPLSRTRTSVGLVMNTTKFKSLGASTEEVLAEAISALPGMSERMRGAVRVSPVVASGDYSYRNTKLCGDRWLLAGDAAGFIDPIFSSGVFLALLGGERAADAIDDVLSNPARRTRVFRHYEKSIRSVMRLYLGFVEAWYRREFIETVMNPQEFFDVVPAVNAVLAGNLGHSFAIRWRLWIFRCLVEFQRFVPVSPRVALSVNRILPAA